MKIGILGAGRIARVMAETLNKMPQAQCYAIGARDLDRAQKFAAEFGCEKAYGSYEELVSDEEVEMIYIATPHSHHAEQVKLCLAHGKHVLCEKAFTANAAQTKEILQMAKEKGLLLTEAIWTRYMPSRAVIQEILESGVIGTPYTLTANLGYVITGKERLVDPKLAGGALLDVGIYPINFARMVFGTDIKEIHSCAILTDRGVDAQNTMTFFYEDGKQAILNSSMLARTDRRGIIAGDKGYMEIVNINNPQEVIVYDLQDTIIARYPMPEQINGYEYEVAAAIKAVREGKLECEEMPHEETIAVMELMDGLRKEWGVIYPFE